MRYLAILALVLFSCTKVSTPVHPLVGTYQVGNHRWKFTNDEFIVSSGTQITGGGIWSLDETLYIVHPIYLELKGPLVYQPESDTTWIFYTESITYYLKAVQ